MFDALKAQWQEFKEAKPGNRFEARYDRRRGAGSLARKIFVMGGGILVMLIGIVFLAIPGPGIPVLIIGAGLIAEESRATARVLDAMEVRIVGAGKRAQAAWRRRGKGA